MALEITQECIGCSACKIVCPSKAINRQEHTYSISHRCNECSGLEQPQCASICPVENAIINTQGVALNPTGSLQPHTNILEEILFRQEATL